MSVDLSPFAAFNLPGDLPAQQSREPGQAPDEPEVEDANRAWAEEVAERVVALWVGRAEVTPIPSTLAEATERVRSGRRRK